MNVKNGHNRPIMDRNCWSFCAQNDQVFCFLQNTTHNCGSIKNRMNPKHKTKLYNYIEIFPPYLAYRTISSNKVEECPNISPQIK